MLALISLACVLESVHPFSIPSRQLTSIASPKQRLQYQYREPRELSAKAKSAPLWKETLWPALGSAMAGLVKEFRAMTRTQKLILFGVWCFGLILGRTKPFWQAFRNVNDIPPRYFGPNAAPLVGKVLSVTDGDTIRFYHTPLWWLPKHLVGRNSKPGKKQKGKVKLSDITLPTRICTIDTPETAKFGKPGQPFGEEAKDELKQMVEDRTVRLKLLQKDQYGRVVAQVCKGWGPLRQYVDEHMLKKGLAEVYTGMGAVYGPLGLEGYLELQEAAMKKKLGIWSQKNRESAAEFKKRTKS